VAPSVQRIDAVTPTSWVVKNWYVALALEPHGADEPGPPARIVVALAPLLAHVAALGVRAPQLPPGVPGDVGQPPAPALLGLEEKDLASVLAREQRPGDLAARHDHRHDDLVDLLVVLDGQEAARAPFARAARDVLDGADQRLHAFDRLGGRELHPVGRELVLRVLRRDDHHAVGRDDEQQDGEQHDAAGHPHELGVDARPSRHDRGLGPGWLRHG
jgi:hypothetical protein